MIEIIKMQNATKNSNNTDLTQLNDLQLLFIFTELICKESSPALQTSAWEIMRRYSGHLHENGKRLLPPEGDTPKWGDAKRVMLLYGLGRSVLDDLRKKELITSKPLNKGRPGSRAKRLYNLRSIDAYLQSINNN